MRVGLIAATGPNHSPSLVFAQVARVFRSDPIWLLQTIWRSDLETRSSRRNDQFSSKPPNQIATHQLINQLDVRWQPGIRVSVIKRSHNMPEPRHLSLREQIVEEPTNFRSVSLIHQNGLLPGTNGQCPLTALCTAQVGFAVHTSSSARP